MAEINRYVIVNEEDISDDWEYDSLHEALASAERRGGRLAIVERSYVYDDSELVWTSTGDDVWPPSTKGS